MNRDLGVWTYADCGRVLIELIDYQKEMFEVIRSETGSDSRQPIRPLGEVGTRSREETESSQGR